MIRIQTTILRILLVFCLYNASPGFLKAQELAETSYLNWFDEQVGIENTQLYEGVIYREFYRTINDKVKFYKSAQWYDGSVIYSGQEFHNIQIKYDVFGDELILKQLDRLGGGAMKLVKSNIRSFQLDGASFVNVQDVPSNTGASGFYELLWTEEAFRLLAKHQKNDFLRRDRNALYYEFIDAGKEYLLDIDGNYYSLARKKDVISVFPDLKKRIDSFYQKNKRLRSNQTDTFMVALIRDIYRQNPETEPIKSP